MVWVLIGHAPNSVQVPCMVFTDKDAALKRCAEIFKIEPQVRDIAFWWHAEDTAGFGRAITNELFTTYYDGGGGAYMAELREVEEGRAFVPFSLD